MPIVSSVTALPVVDLHDRSGQLRARLCEAAHEVGFFYLTGHGVSEVLTRRVPDAGRRADPSDPIFSVYGRNAWKSRLRAHPTSPTRTDTRRVPPSVRRCASRVGNAKILST